MDKSNAGSPGELSSISSQDGEASAQHLGTPGSRTTYEWECDAYAMILDCASRLETNQETLESVGSGELTGGLDAGADDCDSLVRQLDALASDLSSTTVDQAYEDDVEALERLVGWLREWAAALDGAWDGVAASPESERSAVVDEALSDAGATEAVDLYRASVAAAEPQDRG